MTHRLATRACRLIQDRMTAQLRCSVEERDGFAFYSRPYSAFTEQDIASEIASAAWRKQPISQATQASFEALAPSRRQHVAALATSYAIARLRAFPSGRTDAAGSAGLHQATELGASLSEIGARYGAPVLPARPLAPQTGAPADLFELAGNEVGRGAAVTAGVAATAPFPFEIGQRSAADADDTPNASQQSCASSAPFRRSVRR